MTRSKVAVVSATPETAVEDLGRALSVAGDAASSAPALVLLDLVWNRWQPATATTPWQLEAALRALGPARPEVRVAAGRMAGLDPRRAATAAGLGAVLDPAGLAVSTLGEGGGRLRSEERTPALDALHPDGLPDPGWGEGADLLLLPVWKELRGLGPAPSVALAAREFVDLDRMLDPARGPAVVAEAVRLGRERHGRRRVLVDGTAYGHGPGPRRVRPSIQNLLVVGDDPVACDATLCRLLGLDPLQVPVLALCHETGAGAVRSEEIEVVGEAPSSSSRTPWASPSGPQGPLSRLVAAPSLGWARRAARDLLWHPLSGRRWRRLYGRTPWGRLHDDYRRKGGRP